MSCTDIDFLYPMYADIYYPLVTQGSYGEVKKRWTLDRTIICNATPVGGAGTVEIKPATFVEYDGKLLARAKIDLRISSDNVKQAATNIVITNIRSCAGELLYKETAGSRKGQGSIYEIATIEPFFNPFGSVEYYKMLWRKTDDQMLDSGGSDS
jgi:hypothetical protein